MSSKRPVTRQVLVITNWRDRDHRDAGGAELVCEKLAARYAKQGHEVVYLASAVAGRPRVEDRDGYRIVRGGNRFTVYIWVLIWLAWHRRQVAAVIDSQNGIPFFTPVAVRRRTPVVLLIHHVHRDQMAAGLPRPLAKVGIFLEGPACRLVYGRRAIVAVSPSTRQEIRQTLRLRGPITVAPPGLDQAPAGPRRRADNPRIVCVGRLTAHKRTELILHMMPSLQAQFPDLELHIVGEGACRPLLQETAAHLNLGDSVTFHGALSSQDRDELLATGWLSISVSAAEGWGLSVLEANALGVPVLAIRRPGLRDSIRHGETGWLANDEMALTNAAARALKELADLDTAEQWSLRARRWAASFTWEEMAERISRTIRVEQRRLSADRADRRRRSDTVTLVHVPALLVPPTWTCQLRMADRVLDRPEGRLVVLAGTDTEEAREALVRSGLPEQVAYHPAVTCRVARPIDFMIPGEYASRPGPDLHTETPVSALAG